MTYNFASINETLKHGKHYGYHIPKNTPFDFGSFVEKRDARIKVLNRAYETNWDKEGIELIKVREHYDGS
jgi:glutathione reductase (NADPH)